MGFKGFFTFKDTMEYYSAIKKNTFESVLMRWMKLGPIIHSEVSLDEFLNFVFDIFNRFFYSSLSAIVIPEHT